MVNCSSYPHLGRRKSLPFLSVWFGQSLHSHGSEEGQEWCFGLYYSLAELCVTSLCPSKMMWTLEWFSGNLLSLKLSVCTWFPQWLVRRFHYPWRNAMEDPVLSLTGFNQNHLTALDLGISGGLAIFEPKTWCIDQRAQQIQQGPLYLGDNWTVG